MGVLCFSGSAHADLDENVMKKFSCTDMENNEYLNSFDSYYAESANFSESFDLLKKDYHNDMNTRFNTAVSDLSRSVYSGDSDEKACAPLQYEQQDNDSLAEFDSQTRAEFWKYECALVSLLDTKGKIGSNDEISSFEEGISFMKNTEYLILDEIEKSGTAFRLSLEMYGEMRQWYPVHRDLECLISEMETYRNAIRAFIDAVSIMPAKYYQYGSKNQQG